MKYKSQREIAELVLLLKKNLDEAEQFEVFIDGLIRNCKKEYLLKILPQICGAVEDNLELFERGYIEHSNICSCPDELKRIIKEIREGL